MQVLLRLGAPTECRGDLEPCSLVLCDLGKSPTLSVHYIHNMKMTIISPTSQDSCESESPSVVSDSLRPMDYTVHGILQARILEWVAYPSPVDLPNPGTEPGSLTLQADSLPTELSGKPNREAK